MIWIVFAATLTASDPHPSATPAATARATASPPQIGVLGGYGSAPADPDDLDGFWLTSDNGMVEPKTRVYTLEEPCYSSYGGMTLQVDGDHVRGTWTPGHHMQGAMPAYSTTVGESFEGTREGRSLVLRGEYTVRYSRTRNPNVFVPEPPPPVPVEYDLTLDAKTGHLRGTKNGKPFWASRLKFRAPKGKCGPPPP